MPHLFGALLEQAANPRGAPADGRTPDPSPAAKQRGDVGDGRTPEPAVVSIKTTDAVRVAYVEHVGPYWTLGPVFTRVREAMSDADSGPMFANYAGDPTRTPPSKLKTQVGFIAPRAYRLLPPLVAADWEEQLVAFTVVEGPYGTTTRHYSRIYSWIAANGYEAVGPLTEIYASAGGMAPTAAPQTEIRVAVRQVPTDPPLTDALAESLDPPRADGAGEDDTRLDAAVLVPPSMPATLEAPPQMEAPSTAAVAVTDDPLPTVEAVDSTQAADNQSIAELIAAARYEDAALRVMPEGRRIPAGLRPWLDQIVLRIAAVARGVEQVYPGHGQAAKALADAISDRHQELDVANRTTVPHGTAVAAGVESGARAESRRQTLRKLDVLLGRLAFKTATADEATAELTAVVTRISEILGPGGGS